MNKYPKFQPHTKGEQIAFDAAIDKVIYYLDEQTDNYLKLNDEIHLKDTENFIESWKLKNKVLALLDFKVYLEQLFKEKVQITD